MNKKEKKTESLIVKALNNVCNSLENTIEGFSWLTHFVDYSHFPGSLKIVLVFDSFHHLESAKQQPIFNTILHLAEFSLKDEGISLISMEKALYFDTDENGADFNSARWCRKYA